MSKKCNICLDEKDRGEFYANKESKDGLAPTCKTCYKERCRLRLKKLRETDSNWVIKERERVREKRIRLNYKSNLTPEQISAAIKRYKKKYPEKVAAKKRANYYLTKKEGNHLHHWSYNEEHYADCIELNLKDHLKIHRYMVYDPERKMYRTRDNVLLDTKEAHIEYFNSLKDKE